MHLSNSVIETLGGCCSKDANGRPVQSQYLCIYQVQDDDDGCILCYLAELLSLVEAICKYIPITQNQKKVFEHRTICKGRHGYQQKVFFLPLCLLAGVGVVTFVCCLYSQLFQDPFVQVCLKRVGYATVPPRICHVSQLFHLEKVRSISAPLNLTCKYYMSDM